MKVVVLGGGGYLGARLSLFLADRGFDVIPVCYPQLPEDDTWKNKMHCILIGDIQDKKTIQQVVDNTPDVIINLVSLDQYESENTPTQDQFSEKGLKKYIYFSTIHVYGNSLNSLVTEDQQATPSNAYGLTHFLSEEICNYYNRKKKIECINIRLSNSYGEPVFMDANCWDLVVNSLCLSAYKNEKIVLSGDGSAMRDFIYYEVICESIMDILIRNQKLEQNVIHLCSSNSVSMLNVATAVKRVYEMKYNKEIDIFINENELVLGEFKVKQSYTTISNVYLKTLTDPKQVSIEEGIDRIFSYLESNMVKM